ncbi:MAG TPA: hypothetical protein VKP03_01540, partial [Patescibacteria group bacterium]|nr:hypothetical protein [Patescibacteria group bacterium]
MSKKNIASQDAARVIAGTAQCVQALLKAGLTLEDFQRINDDRLVREKLVHYWKSEGESVLEVPNFTSQAEAREIMGENFLGLPEVRRNYGLTKEHSEALLEVPFSPTALQSCQYTHVLVADMGF